MIICHLVLQVSHVLGLVGIFFYFGYKSTSTDRLLLATSNLISVILKLKPASELPGGLGLLKLRLLSTPNYSSEEIKNANSKRCMYPSVHSSIIYNSQDMKKT